MLNPTEAMDRSLETPRNTVSSVGGVDAVVASPTALSAVLAFRRMHALHDAGSFTAIRARSQGAATRLVGLTWLNEFQALIAAPGSRIRSVRDLRDRKIGRAAPNAGGDDARVATLRGVIAALEIHGLSHRHVEWIDLISGREAAALLDGTVDAIYVTGLRGIETARATGARTVFSASDHRDRWIRTNTALLGTLTVDEELLTRCPDLVAQDLGSVREAAAWARSEPQQFLVQLATRLRSSVDNVRLAFGPDIYQRVLPELAESSMEALGELKRFLLRWGFVWTDFDVRSWVEPPLSARAGSPLSGYIS